MLNLLYYWSQLIFGKRQSVAYFIKNDPQSQTEKYIQMSPTNASLILNITVGSPPCEKSILRTDNVCPCSVSKTRAVKRLNRRPVTPRRFWVRPGRTWEWWVTLLTRLLYEKNGGRILEWINSTLSCEQPNMIRFQLPGGGVLGSGFGGYVPLASMNLHPIIVYSVTNYRPHLSHFWANVIVISRTEFNASRLLNIKTTAGTIFQPRIFLFFNPCLPEFSYPKNPENLRPHSSNSTKNVTPL